MKPDPMDIHEVVVYKTPYRFHNVPYEDGYIIVCKVCERVVRITYAEFNRFKSAGNGSRTVDEILIEMVKNRWALFHDKECKEVA